MPRSMRMALVGSIGAAVLSTSVALVVVLDRHDDANPPPAADLVSTAAAATVKRSESSSVDPAPPPAVEPVPVGRSTEPAVPSMPWPDLSKGVLPPVDSAPAQMGQSLGSPRDGALLRAKQLPSGRHYVIRNPDTAWGTSNTIEKLQAAIAKTRREHPQIHRLVVGDISTRRGGPLSGHTSHQAGRDVDLGLVYRSRPEGAAPEFIEATREILDRRATYDLIAALASTRDQPDGVELIVLDYGLQRLLRKSAESRGVPEQELEELFQFPHGPTSRHGLIRHKPAHRDHLHVRFKCPTGDEYCRNPLIGFGGMEADVPMGNL